MPLATLDMQKRVTRELRMPGEAIMKMAEELYQGGFISYPRTETDGFSKDYDLLVRDAMNEVQQSPFSESEVPTANSVHVDPSPLTEHSVAVGNRQAASTCFDGIFHCCVLFSTRAAFVWHSVA